MAGMLLMGMYWYVNFIWIQDWRPKTCYGIVIGCPVSRSWLEGVTLTPDCA